MKIMHRCKKQVMHDCSHLVIAQTQDGIWEMRAHIASGVICDSCSLWITYCPFCGDKL